MKHIHIQEEHLIDFHLGNLSKEKKELITRHLHECEQCRSILRSWESILESGLEEMPTPNLKERLHKSLLKEKKKHKYIQKYRNAFVVATISAALLYLVFQFTIVQNRAIDNPTFVHVAEKQNVNMLHYPETRQLPITPVADFQEVNGNIWVNYFTDEMFVEIFQLPNVRNRVYQLWIVYDDDNFKGELISAENGMSRILLQGRSIHDLKRIKASLEPLGGSPIPTGPEPFIVELPVN